MSLNRGAIAGFWFAVRVIDNDVKLLIECLALTIWEVGLAESSRRALKLLGCWQESRGEKDLEPDAKTFRPTGGVGGKGWYYMMDSTCFKGRVP